MWLVIHRTHKQITPHTISCITQKNRVPTNSTVHIPSFPRSNFPNGVNERYKLPRLFRRMTDRSPVTYDLVPHLIRVSTIADKQRSSRDMIDGATCNGPLPVGPFVLVDVTVFSFIRKRLIRIRYSVFVWIGLTVYYIDFSVKAWISFFYWYLSSLN